MLTHTAIRWLLDDPRPWGESIDLSLLTEDELRHYARDLQAETIGLRAALHAALTLLHHQADRSPRPVPR